MDAGNNDMIPKDIEGKMGLSNEDAKQPDGSKDSSVVLSSSSDDGISSKEGGESNKGRSKKKSKAEASEVAPYRDFSRERPDPIEKEGAQNFPMKLHAILSNPEFQVRLFEVVSLESAVLVVVSSRWCHSLCRTSLLGSRMEELGAFCSTRRSKRRSSRWYVV